MHSPSFFAVVWIFARTAFRRLLNASAALQRLARRQSPETTRQGTLSRSDSRTTGSRLISWLILGSTLFGGILLTSISVATLIETVRLEEMTSSRTIVLSETDYDELAASGAASTSAEPGPAVLEAIKQISERWTAVWIKPRVSSLLTERIAKQGLAGFRKGPLDPALRGDLSLLTVDSQRRAVRSIAFFTLLFNASTITLAMAAMNRTLSGNDPILNWLFQFPISRRALFTSRLAELIFDSPVLILNVVLASILVSQSGVTFWIGLGYSLVFGLTAALFTAAVRLALEIVLLRYCGRKLRGALIAVACNFGNLVLLFCMLGINAPLTARGLTVVADQLPAVVYLQPWSIAFGERNLLIGSRGIWALAAFGFAVIAAAASVLLADRATRNGIGGEGESQRGPADRTLKSRSHSRLKGMLAKEWMQVWRQPELLLQAVLAPLLILAFIFLRDTEASLRMMTKDAGAVCVSIFAVAAYVLTSASSTVLLREFQSLWILQTLPRSLADIVRTKSRFWSVIVLLPALSVAVWAVTTQAEVSPVLIRLPFTVAFVWLFGEIIFGAIALGATCPTEGTVKFRSSMWVLPGLIATQAAAALYVGQLWPLMGSLVILATIDLAVRQRLVAELPWITEPIEQPQQRFDVIHALITIGAFLQTRNLLSQILANTQLGAVDGLLLGFAISACLIASVVLYWQMRSGLWLPQIAPAANGWSTLFVGCFLAVAIAGSWVFVLSRSEELTRLVGPMMRLPESLQSLDVSAGLKLVAFLVVAPLFEEWLFRGLLFRSLRRTHTFVASAVLSAFLFTIIHPVDSSVGVMALAVINAVVYERTGRLAAPVLVHFLYNLTVMAMWTQLAS